jgi:hypothetical protein
MDKVLQEVACDADDDGGTNPDHEVRSREGSIDGAGRKSPEIHSIYRFSCGGCLLKPDFGCFAMVDASQAGNQGGNLRALEELLNSTPSCLYPIPFYSDHYFLDNCCIMTILPCAKRIIRLTLIVPHVHKPRYTRPTYASQLAPTCLFCPVPHHSVGKFEAIEGAGMAKRPHCRVGPLGPTTSKVLLSGQAVGHCSATYETKAGNTAEL